MEQYGTLPASTSSRDASDGGRWSRERAEVEGRFPPEVWASTPHGHLPPLSWSGIAQRKTVEGIRKITVVSSAPNLTLASQLMQNSSSWLELLARGEGIARGKTSGQR